MFLVAQNGEIIVNMNVVESVINMCTRTKLYGMTKKQYRKLKADRALNQIAVLSERICRLEDIILKHDSMLETLKMEVDLFKVSREIREILPPEVLDNSRTILVNSRMRTPIENEFMKKIMQDNSCQPFNPPWWNGGNITCDEAEQND